MNQLLNKRYQLEKPLGRGGMAVVYKARDLMLERTIAVKILRENFSRSPAFQERFRQEAKAAANLSHPKWQIPCSGGYSFIFASLRGDGIRPPRGVNPLRC